MFFVEQYPLEVIPWVTLPSLFLALQVTIGIESTIEIMVAQLFGLNEFVIISASSLNASESILR